MNMYVHTLLLIYFYLTCICFNDMMTYILSYCFLSILIELQRPLVNGSSLSRNLKKREFASK